MQKLEISVDAKTSLADVRKNVLRLRGVSKCETTGPQTVCVSYDETQIVAKLIVKACGCQKGQRRRNNIVSVREIAQPHK